MDEVAEGQEEACREEIAAILAAGILRLRKRAALPQTTEEVDEADAPSAASTTTGGRSPPPTR